MTVFIHKGMRYHISFHGDKGNPPLVLLHGFAQSSETWSTVVQKLISTFYIIAPDLAGHGKSAHPANRQPYSFEGLVVFLDAVVDRLASGHTALLGYSMGGRIALTYAFAHPKKVKCLILESAGIGLSPHQKKEVSKQNAAFVKKIQNEGIDAFMNYWEKLPLFSSQESLPKDIKEKVREERLKNKPESLILSLQGSGQHLMEDFSERIGKLSMPVLYIAGSKDTKYCSIAAMLEEAKSATGVVLAAGHNTHLEVPEAFASAITDFYHMS